MSDKPPFASQIDSQIPERGENLHDTNIRKIGNFFTANALALTTLGFSLGDIRSTMQEMVTKDELWQGLELTLRHGESERTQ